MKISFAAMSEVGPRRVNEDFLDCRLAESGETVACIADGLGGMGGGDVASRLAVEAFCGHLKEHGIDEETLGAAVAEAHQEIRKEQLSNVRCSSMATTLTAAAFSNAGIVGAHCGDTRAVLARQAEMRQLTRDHSEAQRLFDAGKLSEDEFMHHERKHILENALGDREKPRIDTFHSGLLPGDRVLLTTDGVHDLLFPHEMQRLSSLSSTAEELIDRTAKMIRERGPTDNYSMIVVCAD